MAAAMGLFIIAYIWYFWNMIPCFNKIYSFLLQRLLRMLIYLLNCFGTNTEDYLV
jgi:hypothetical protein